MLICSHCNKKLTKLKIVKSNDKAFLIKCEHCGVMGAIKVENQKIRTEHD